MRLGPSGGSTTSNYLNGSGPDILNLALTFGSPNNGNLASEQIANNDSTNLNVMQQFEYDAYNRLSFAVETPTSSAPTLSSSSTCSSLGLAGDPWCQQYGYDAFGNRWVTNWSSGSSGYPISTVTPTSSSWYSSNNRLSTTAPGAQYDNNIQSSPGGNGNLTGLGGFAYAFDAENRMTQSTINSAITTYLYDGEGRRVNKATGNTSTTYVYDAAGGLVAKYSNAPIENGGPQPAGTQYLTDDHLGSTRLVTDALGNPQKRYDYLPFGEEIPQGLDGRSMTMYGPPLIPGPTEDTVNNKFTGKERDSETGLDFFEARYMSSSQGRFTSPDRPTIDQHPDAPQSWNLYSYVRNNPLKFIDPSGLGCLNDLGATSNGGRQIGIANGGNSADCGANGGTWVPGDIDKNNVGFYLTSDGTVMFQVTTQDAGNVYYSSFVSGATTDENGVGKGASIAHASADWLSSMLVGGNLPQMMSFAAQRTEARGGGPLMALLAGPGFSLNAPDNWAGPGGRGTPQGQGDWSAMAHDYNFWNWNGGMGTDKITLGSLFSFRNSPEKAQALIHSNHNLVRNAGGNQSVKMELMFGVVNAFQWYVTSWK